VKNRGPYASSGGRVTIQFPAGATGIAASTQSGSCTLRETSAQCNFGAIILNASAAIALSATPDAAGSFVASVTVEGDQPDAAPSNNAASHSVVVLAPTPPSTAPGGGTSGGIVGGVATPAPQPVTTSGGGGGGGGGSLLVLVASAAVLRRAMARTRQTARCYSFAVSGPN